MRNKFLVAVLRGEGNDKQDTHHQAVPLLDEEALLACSVYVDLNQAVRAPCTCVIDSVASVDPAGEAHSQKSRSKKASVDRLSSRRHKRRHPE